MLEPFEDVLTKLLDLYGDPRHLDEVITALELALMAKKEEAEQADDHDDD